MTEALNTRQVLYKYHKVWSQTAVSQKQYNSDDV